MNFKTFFGADVVNYLRRYLNTRPKVSDQDPLFAKLGSDERVTPGAIQYKFREYAEKIGLFSDFDFESRNPARPLNFRSAFKSRLTNEVDPDLIEFLMGHAIGELLAHTSRSPMMSFGSFTPGLSMS